MSADLTIVPTPIGNLSDMSFRAIETLREVDIILAEDTRTSARLLQHYDIDTPMRSFHMHNEHKKVLQVIEELRSGTSMALISDAGTPGISDPGYLLVSKAIEEGLDVECLPGSTAFVPALVVSGLPTDRFVYEGFLPQKKGRQTRLKSILEQTSTTVLYESPHRILKLLRELMELRFDDRRISISREISKKFEETLRGTAVELQAHFTETEPKGEFVVVIEGKKKMKKNES